MKWLAVALKLYFNSNSISFRHLQTGARSCRCYKTVNMSSDMNIQHSEDQKEFFIQLDDSEKAVLQYDIVKPGVVDMYHTGVPTSYRGRGIAKQLAVAALEHMVNKDYKMILSCSYLDKYVKDNPHPQYTSRTVTE